MLVTIRDASTAPSSPSSGSDEIIGADKPALPKLGNGNNGLSFHRQSHHLNLTGAVFGQVLLVPKTAWRVLGSLAEDVKSSVGHAGTAIQQMEILQRFLTFAL